MTTTPEVQNCAHEKRGEIIVQGVIGCLALEYCKSCNVVLMPRKSEPKTESTGPYFVAAILALFLAGSALAQSVERCPATSTRCAPPPTWRSVKSKPPLDAPVKFGGEEIRQGEKYWRWIRNGDPSRPCTVAEALATKTTECKAKIGDVLFVTQRFRVKE